MKSLKLFILLVLVNLKGIAQEQNILVEKTLWNVRLNEPYYFDYHRENSLFKVFPAKIIEDVTHDLAVKFIQAGLDSTKNFIYPFQKLTFDYDAKKTVIIKFMVSIDSVFSKKQTLIFQKKLGDSIWYESQIPELSNIQTALQYLKSDSFWAFYNQDKSEIPEIDAIKANFKDAEGILDIDKLGAYLKTKPKELEKFCDY